MPVKLFLNFRCLQPSIPVARYPTMKAFPQPVNASRVIPIFCGIFSHNFSCCDKQLGKTQFRNTAARRFSTRLGRARSQEVPASRSLIEDEAELSDWVSGLSSSSFKRTQLYEDSDKDSDMNEADSDGFRRGRGKGRGREETTFGKRRVSSFGESNGLGRRGGDRGPQQSHPRRRDSSFEKFRESDRGGRDNFSVESSRRGDKTFEKFREYGRGGRTHGSTDSHSRRDGSFDKFRTSSRGGRAHGSMGSRSSRVSSFEKFRESGSSRGGRTPGSVESHSGRPENVVSREKSWNSNEILQRGSEKRGRFGGEMEVRRENRRGGKGSELRTGMGRGGGGGEIGRDPRGERRRGLVVSDEDGVDGEEEEDEQGFQSFKELIGSDEDSEVDEEDEGGDDMFSRGSVLRDSSPCSPIGTDSYLTETRFDQVPISPLSMKGVKDAGYERMTAVQEATLPVILKGKDVMAKARTGTGKTVAFLVNALHPPYAACSMNKYEVA